jgi:DNA helicase-2/ATP-dependent DNA helicase PcrA
MGSALLNTNENPREVDYKKAVTLTTMHSSKGLEYDVVFMVDLCEDEIPGLKAIESAKKNEDYFALEEERRLFYVGMTRAKEFLYLISLGSKSERSTFVKEVEQIMHNNIIDDIGEGMIITHKYFGEGVVVAILEQKNKRILLEIDFKGVRRILDLIICVNNGLIIY